MKYCKSCQTIHSSSTESCPHCKKNLGNITEINTPVYLTTACGFDRSRIEGVLKDNKIIYSEKPEKKESGAISIVGSYNENYRIFVPFQAYITAKNLLADIGIDINSCIDDEETEKSIASIKSEKNIPDIKSGSNILLMLVFLALIAGAVFLTDAVIAWIQSIF